MWRAEQSRGTLFVSLGARRVEAAVQVRGRWLGDSAVAFAIEPGAACDPVVAALTQALSQALVQVSDALQHWCEMPRTDGVVLRELRVLVADCWLTWATLPWSDGLADSATADTYVRAQLAAGGTPCDATDAVRVDDAAYGQPRVVARFPAGVMDALSRFAAGLGLALRSVCPLSVAAWTAAPRGGSRVALAVLDEGLTAVVQGGRRIGEVIVRGPLSEVAEGDAPVRALQGLWNRLRARDPQFAALPGLAVLDLAQVVGYAALPDAALPTGLQRVKWPTQPPGAPPSRRLQLAALCASRTASHTSGLDAVPAAGSPPWLRWAAAAAVTAALLGGAQAWRVARQAQATQAEWAALREIPAPVVRQVPWSREDLARVQAVNAAVRELNLPISALLAALQPPGDLRVAVLGVDVASGAPVVAGGSSSVKISAQARSGADMARYVAYVAQRRPFGSAYLVRHEIATEAPDRPYRFTVEAQWKD